MTTSAEAGVVAVFGVEQFRRRRELGASTTHQAGSHRGYLGVPYDVPRDGERLLVGIADQGGPASPAVLVLNMIEGLARK